MVCALAKGKFLCCTRKALRVHQPRAPGHSTTTRSPPRTASTNHRSPLFFLSGIFVCLTLESMFSDGPLVDVQSVLHIYNDSVLVAEENDSLSRPPRLVAPHTFIPQASSFDAGSVPLRPARVYLDNEDPLAPSSSHLTSPLSLLVHAWLVPYRIKCPCSSRLPFISL